MISTRKTALEKLGIVLGGAVFCGQLVAALALVGVPGFWWSGGALSVVAGLAVLHVFRQIDRATA